MRTFATDKLRHLPSKKRLAMFVLFLIVCGGAVTGQV
jgi:hypothetical protein